MVVIGVDNNGGIGKRTDPVGSRKQTEMGSNALVTDLSLTKTKFTLHNLFTSKSCTGLTTIHGK